MGMLSSTGRKPGRGGLPKFAYQLGTYWSIETGALCVTKPRSEHIEMGDVQASSLRDLLLMGGRKIDLVSMFLFCVFSPGGGGSQFCTSRHNFTGI